MNETFDDLRPHLLDYLHSRGINPRRRFRCLNPDHPDRNPSMGYDSRRCKVHCFACGADYDLFDLLQLDEHLSTPGEALERARTLYGTAAPPPPKPEALPGDYLTRCAAHRRETAYFSERGISETTAERFSLGYDSSARCVVLPCAGGQFVRRSTEEKRYLNQKGIPSPLFQPELLLGEGPVFLAEGVFDALSAEEMGFSCVAMNGAGNREKIAALLRQREAPGLILLVPDNDRAGDTWAQELLTEFPWLYRCPPIPTGKDLNDLLLSGREAATAYLSAAVAAARAQQPAPYEDSSAARQIESLRQYILSQAARPRLSTGIEVLDKALDGGLYEGLYIVGAVSSLGKTAFCMQIADALARQGQDVLVFSLEMSAHELMARSISRETFLADATPGKQLSKTVRGILDGRRWAGYTAREHAHLQAAMEAYGTYADHLYIRQGDHDTGLEIIAGEVERHIAQTGRVPVVLIDYLQIIAPVDVHFTDKQNTDRAVCALKKLSRAHEATILAISSFNRENYNTPATMASFKESGGIDYSADVLIGLQARGAGGRGFDLEAEKRKDPREIEVKILKNRTAALSRPIPLRYYPAYSCFQTNQ